MSKPIWWYQNAVAEWSRRNFPNQDSTLSLLGIQEEVGELSHAHLKDIQGIRGTKEEHHAAKVDAVADIFIFLLDYCQREGIALDEAVRETWDQVSQRNWTANPHDGSELEGRTTVVSNGQIVGEQG